MQKKYHFSLLSAANLLWFVVCCCVTAANECSLIEFTSSGCLVNKLEKQLKRRRISENQKLVNGIELNRNEIKVKKMEFRFGSSLEKC